jgi:hypothetical protein
MRTSMRLLIAATLCLAVATSAGCTAKPEASAGSSGMGMQGGSGAGAMGSGVIAASKNASLKTASFHADSGAIEAPMVLAPADGWMVARSTTPTGGVLGVVQVRKGENRDVVLKLGAIDGREVSVGLFVDRGTKGTFEFNPERPLSKPDKPVLVDGALVESGVTLLGWGVEAQPNSVLVLADDQKASATLEINYLLIPASSWIEVRRVIQGAPAERIGLVLRPVGEFQRVMIPIKGAKPKDQLLVTVLADRGVEGTFEPGLGDPANAVDQPWISAGVVASDHIVLK